MKNLFVPYEIALKLKEKGFNEQCLAVYNSSKTFIPIDSFKSETDLVKNSELNENGQFCTAPLYQQVIDFLKSKGYHLQERLEGWFIVETKSGKETTDEVMTIDYAIEEALKLI